MFGPNGHSESTTVPPLQTVLATVALGAGDWLVVAVEVLLIVIAAEITKHLLARRSARS